MCGGRDRAGWGFRRTESYPLRGWPCPLGGRLWMTAAVVVAAGGISGIDYWW